MASENHILNGLSVNDLSETIDTIANKSELGKFQVAAKTTWIHGGHCQTRIKQFCSGGEILEHRHAHILEADEPEELLGTDLGANATEALLHAVASCLSASFIYHATAQNINIHEMEMTLTGNLDLNGFLGIDENIPSGFQDIQINWKVKSNATDQQLQDLCKYAQARSPVFNSVKSPVPINVNLEILHQAWT
jgi:uncharacterized OsmC-like protein